MATAQVWYKIQNGGAGEEQIVSVGLYSDIMITRYGAINHSEVNEERTGEHFVLTKHRNRIIGEHSMWNFRILITFL